MVQATTALRLVTPSLVEPKALTVVPPMRPHPERELSREEYLATGLGLAFIPEEFIAAMRDGRVGEVVRMGQWKIVLAEHDGIDDAGILAAWSTVFRLRVRVCRQVRLSAAAADDDMPTMYRTEELPEQISVLFCDQCTHPVFVCSPATKRRALATALAVVGYPLVHEVAA